MAVTIQIRRVRFKATERRVEAARHRIQFLQTQQARIQTAQYPALLLRVLHRLLLSYRKLRDNLHADAAFLSIGKSMHIQEQPERDNFSHLPIWDSFVFRSLP